MFYRLNDMYELRGWDRLSWVLVRRLDNRIRVLTAEVFQVLLLCDGETEIDSDILTEEMEKTLKQYIEEKIVSASETKRPLNQDQHYRVYNNRYVQTAFWSMTGKCNCRCRHCFMDAPEGLFGELSHDEAMNLIDQMADCGIMHVLITGGEPLVRKDFWQLIDRMCEKRIIIDQIYTNALLLNDKVLDEFEKRGIFAQLVISFDGVGWHDWMRGVPGTEEKALEAMKTAVRRGYPVLAGMCTHKGNVKSIRATVKKLAEIGVYALKIGGVNDTDLWKKNCEGNRLSKKEYYDAMVEYIPYFYEDGMPINLMIGNVIQMNAHSTDFVVMKEFDKGEGKCEERLLCNSARFSCYITPEGRLLPCLPMTANMEIQKEFPLISEIGLQKGLSDGYYMEFVNRKAKDLFAANPKCNACQYKSRCLGGCRACALDGIEHSLMGVDDGMCLFYHGGYPEKIRAAAEAAIAKYCPDAKKENE